MMFTFYTYDAMGRDATIKVYADSESDAWSQFRSQFPKNPVDFVDRD